MSGPLHGRYYTLPRGGPLPATFNGTAFRSVVTADSAGRNRLMVLMRLDGWTLDKIAKATSVTRERVRQILYHIGRGA